MSNNSSTSVGVMCADEGHYDVLLERAPVFVVVGVMCADEGHYDSTQPLRVCVGNKVGVMCADEGHYDNQYAAIHLG